MKNINEQLLDEANKLKLTSQFAYAGIRNAHWGYIVWLVEEHSLGGTIEYRYDKDFVCTSVSISLQTISLIVVNELSEIIIKLIK